MSGYNLPNGCAPVRYALRLGPHWVEIARDGQALQTPQQCAPLFDSREEAERAVADRFRRLAEWGGSSSLSIEIVELDADMQARKRDGEFVPSVQRLHAEAKP